MAKQEEEIISQNPWLDKEYKQGLPLFTREPGLEIDDLPERLGLLDEVTVKSSIEATRFIELTDTPSDYGLDKQFPMSDGEGAITWDYPFWKPSGSSIYFRKRVAVGHSHPMVQFHVYRPTETCTMRIGAKIRPWIQWHEVDNNRGFSFGVDAVDQKFHFHYDTPIGTESISFMLFDAATSRVGILQDSPAYVFDVTGDGRFTTNLYCDDFYLNDTDATHTVLIHWNENESTANRTLNFTLGGGTRTFALHGNLTVESASLINQDLTSDSTAVAFGDLTLTAGHLELSNAVAQVQFTGTAGGNGEGILYKDSGSTNRYGLLFEATNKVVLGNRASNGTVELRANTSTAGSGGEVTVVTIEDTLVTFAKDILVSEGEGISVGGTPVADSIRIETSNTDNPFYCLKTTNTAHEIHVALDESATADHVDYIGQTASVDTYFHVVGQVGQTAKLGVQIGSYRGELICGSAGHISLKNITSDLDLVFGIKDGATNKTITWDADVDKLKHSAGTFDFDDDDLTTLGKFSLTGIINQLNSAVNTAADFIGLKAWHTKTAGASDHDDTFYGYYGLAEMNQNGGEISHLYGGLLYARMTDGNVGDASNSRNVVGQISNADLNAGKVWGDAKGLSAIVDQEGANEVTGNIMGINIRVDADGTLGGNAYMLYLDEQTNVDYGIYQNGTAINYFGGNVGIGQVTFGTNATQTFAIDNGVAPTSSPADCFQMYSADQAGGNACAHFRCEGGGIVKAYQQAHIADAVTSHTLTDASETCDRSEIEGFLDALGTKINAIYTALENNGLLASA